MNISASLTRTTCGRIILPMSGQTNAKSPHEAYFYYWAKHLQAVRSGKWKLHLTHDYDHPDPPGHDGKPGKYAKREIGVALFDLESDVSETNNLAAQHPDVVAEISAAWQRWDVQNIAPLWHGSPTEDPTAPKPAPKKQ